MSIILYKEKINSNFIFKVFENLRLRKDIVFMLRDVRKRGFSEIVEKYKDYDPYPGYSKYLDIKPWFIDNLWRCYIMGLHFSPKMNILDIGTGNGYFPFICQKYGHTVRTIDVDSNPIFNSLIKILEIPRREYFIKANERIKPFDVKFDLVTGFHTYFNGHRTENVWTSKEWNYFLFDLKENLCNPNASAYFIINKEHDRDKIIEDELLNYFMLIDAEVDGDRLFIPNLSKVI